MYTSWWSSLTTEATLLLWSLSLSFIFLFGGCSSLGLLISLLGLHFLDVSILEFLLGGFNSGISCFWVFISLSLDILKTHTDHSFLNSSGSSGSLFLNILNSHFLVLSSPSLGPSELDWLDFLMVKRSSFGGNEIMDFTIFTSELRASTWPNSHLREWAGIRLNNHLSDSKK